MPASHVVPASPASPASPLRRADPACDSGSSSDSTSGATSPRAGISAGTKAAMLPTLRLSQVRHGGRTWTAVPPLDLPIVCGADHVWTAEPSIGLYARADAPEALEDAVGAALARLWDAVMIERWELLPPEDLALLLVLVEHFQVKEGRPRPVAIAGYDPACAPGCLGGAGCAHGRGR